MGIDSDGVVAFIERSCCSPGVPGRHCLNCDVGILIQARTKKPIFAIAKIAPYAPPRHTETHPGKPLSHES